MTATAVLEDTSPASAMCETDTCVGKRLANRSAASSRAVRSATDRELVAMWIAGDEHAFAEIYGRYYGMLYAYALRLGGPCDAADAVQEAMIKASSRIQQLQDPGSLRPWLFAIVRNQLYNAHRKRTATTVAPETLASVAGEERGPAELALHDDAAELLWRAASGLGERDRRIIELSLRDGLAGAELSAALGVDPAHGYVLIGRARRRLGAAMVALAVARSSRMRCAALWATFHGSHFTPVVRRKIEMHMRACKSCRQCAESVGAGGALLAS